MLFPHTHTLTKCKRKKNKGDLVRRARGKKGTLWSSLCKSLYLIFITLLGMYHPSSTAEVPKVPGAHLPGVSFCSSL
jgi:hypothetical protein